MYVWELVNFAYIVQTNQTILKSRPPKHHIQRLKLFIQKNWHHMSLGPNKTYTYTHTETQQFITNGRNKLLKLYSKYTIKYSFN